MTAFLDANQIKDQVSLLNLLKNLGHNPVKTSGQEYFYLSMFREERTPSLCVNDSLGVWFDHGGPGISGIKGGNVIDFGLAYWYPSTFVEVLFKLKDISSLELLHVSDPEKLSSRREKIATKLPNYKIEAIRELGNNYAITDYLQYRGIWGVADEHLSEVYYFVQDDKNKRKNFFASGWVNENGGWEVRNKYFKGCLGHKGMSFFEKDPSKLCVFEGYFDFLSWKFDNENDQASVLVLNSLSLLLGSISRAMSFNKVELYFDHDPSGRAATNTFTASVKTSKDCSDIYLGFKDYNEKLMSELEIIKSRSNRVYPQRPQNAFNTGR